MLKELAVAGLMTVTGAGLATASTITVPGTADPWLAGMPPGSTASFFDVAPDHSPVEVPGLTFVAGEYVTFTLVEGATDHCPAAICGLAGPDGDLSEPITSHTSGAENGISDIIAPIDALLAVFLGPDAPDGLPAPSALDFSTAAARDYDRISPALRQVFFVGDGVGSAGVQAIQIPVGATRLFLGTMDGFGWFDNVGSLRVEALNLDIEGTAPEPVSLLLFGIGLVAATGILRRRLHARSR
jgi:hypothetical protein